jgi:Ca2+-binding RTX toxin-like protein
VPVTLAGGGGADDLQGGPRFDRLLGGTGADRFAWASGQSDTIDGGPNADRLRVDGTGAAEAFSVTHPDNRVHVTRDVGSVDLSVGTVERLDLRVVGGADDVAVGDLTGSGMGRVEVLLAATLGGTTPDGVQDEVTLTGRSSVDNLVIGPDGPGVRVAGMAPLLVLRHADATDRLIVSGASAADRLDATALPAGRVLLRLLGGPGNDVLRGSPGNDDFDGGIGTDTIQGGAGTDTAVNGEVVTGVP